MKVAKWGNSLAIRIPKDVAESLGIREGDDVDLQAAEKPVISIARQMTREEAIRELRRFRGTMPADYVFDRNEANAR